MTEVDGEHPAPFLVGIGAVFIDDIVLPGDRIYRDCLGGGVIHALLGAAVWDECPGLMAVAGRDLPEAALSVLRQTFDLRGLHWLDLPQIRAWQYFDAEGNRSESYQVDVTEPFIRGAQPEHFPAAYADSQAYYLLQGFDGIRTWRDKLNGFILWEPLQQVMLPENREAMRETLQGGGIDVVSPNLLEARLVYGDLPPEDLITAMFVDGARMVALRMGAAGSLIANRETGERQFIASVPVNAVVDQTGAGNTYCGTLAAALGRGKSLRDAGAMAAVSASFCVEQVGVVVISGVTKEEKNQRYHRVR
ncbi:MAG: hypothetical protein H6672_11660 [Anaerolineaceae bacterium]|nr:hypothetical protein [Anaerolineaceae bacterium]